MSLSGSGLALSLDCGSLWVYSVLRAVLTPPSVRVPFGLRRPTHTALLWYVVVGCTRFLWSYSGYQHRFVESVWAPPLRMDGGYLRLPIRF